MDIVLIILAFILILVGFAGSIVPALPGPPLAFAGLLVTYFTSFQPVSVTWLVVYVAMVVLVALADLWLPALATKVTRGTRQGATGANIGMLAGIFIPIPFSIFIGAFTGSLIGEMASGKALSKALIASCGVFIGLLGGMVMKCLLCMAMLLHLIIGLVR